MPHLVTMIASPLPKDWHHRRSGMMYRPDPDTGLAQVWDYHIAEMTAQGYRLPEPVPAVSGDGAVAGDGTASGAKTKSARNAAPQGQPEP